MQRSSPAVRFAPRLPFFFTDNLCFYRTLNLGTEPGSLNQRPAEDEGYKHSW